MRTRELVDGTSRILARRNLRRSLLVAEWYPPGRYTVADLFLGNDGAIQLDVGRLHLARYRR